MGHRDATEVPRSRRVSGPYAGESTPERRVKRWDRVKSVKRVHGMVDRREQAAVARRCTGAQLMGETQRPFRTTAATSAASAPEADLHVQSSTGEERRRLVEHAAAPRRQSLQEKATQGLQSLPLRSAQGLQGLQDGIRGIHQDLQGGIRCLHQNVQGVFEGLQRRQRVASFRRQLRKEVSTRSLSNSTSSSSRRQFILKLLPPLPLPLRLPLPSSLSLPPPLPLLPLPRFPLPDFKTLNLGPLGSFRPSEKETQPLPQWNWQVISCSRVGHATGGRNSTGVASDGNGLGLRGGVRGYADPYGPIGPPMSSLGTGLLTVLLKQAVTAFLKSKVRVRKSTRCFPHFTVTSLRCHYSLLPLILHWQ